MQKRALWIVLVLCGLWLCVGSVAGQDYDPSSTVAMAVSEDGLQYAMIRHDLTMTIYGSATYQATHTILIDSVGPLIPTYQLRDTAFSPDGHLIAVAFAGDSGLLQVYEIATGQKIMEDRVSGGVYTLAWNPDNKSIAAIIKEGGPPIVSVLRIVDGVQIAELRKREGSGIVGLSWSADGQWLSSGNFSSVNIWNTATWELQEIRTGNQTVMDVVWSPDGQQLAAVDVQGNIHILDRATSQKQIEIPTLRSVDDYLELAWDEHGLWILNTDRLAGYNSVTFAREFHVTVDTSPIRGFGRLANGDLAYAIFLDPDIQIISPSELVNNPAPAMTQTPTSAP